MSGGHWDYEQERIGSFASYRLDAEKEALLAEFGVDFVSPVVSALEACAKLLHDIDWHLCCDTMMQDPAARLQAFKDALREACK